MDIKITPLFLQIHGGEYQNIPFYRKTWTVDFLKRIPLYSQILDEAWCGKVVWVRELCSDYKPIETVGGSITNEPSAIVLRWAIKAVFTFFLNGRTTPFSRVETLTGCTAAELSCETRDVIVLIPVAIVTAQNSTHVSHRHNRDWLSRWFFNSPGVDRPAINECKLYTIYHKIVTRLMQFVDISIFCMWDNLLLSHSWAFMGCWREIHRTIAICRW